MEIKHGYFGKFMTDDMNIPENFKLWQIKTPLFLHYSPVDRLVSPKDVNQLIPLLNNTQVYVQNIDEKDFNHIDFLWGVDAASIIYTKILKFFSMHDK